MLSTLSCGGANAATAYYHTVELRVFGGLGCMIV